jgi:NTE family protein
MPFQPLSAPLPRWLAALCLLLIGWLDLPSVSRAQGTQGAQHLSTPAAHTPGTQRPRIGLVLSGGGARGFAHVGVLQALEQARVPVDFVVGTSMGAIIVGLYASGMSGSELERELMSLDWATMFERREPRQSLTQRRKEEDFEFSAVLQLGFRDGEFRLPSGAVSTRGLELLLRRYTLSTRHLATFDGLPTPFRAVSTDMETGQPVVMDHGDLAAALRASMSVPGVFAPLELDGRILGDGGLVNNLPVDVARRLGADVVIAVNIGTPLAGRETLGSVLGIATQMVNILTEQNVQASVATLTTHDLLLVPPLGALSSSDFERAPELVRLGQQYGQAVQASLARFAVDPTAYTAWSDRRESMAQTNAARLGPLMNYRIEGVNESRVARLAPSLETPDGQAVDVKQIEEELRRLAATGDYERVDYQLERPQGSRGETLVIRLRENTWGPNYLRLGMDLRTDFRGEGGFNLRISHNRNWLTHSGTEWRNRIQLGETTGLYSEIYQPLNATDDVFASTYVDTRVRKLDILNTDGDTLARVRREGLRVGADIGFPMGLLGHLGDARVGVVASRRRVTPELIIGNVLARDLQPVQWRDVGLRLALVTDQLNFANFPSEGYRLQAEAIAGRRSVDNAPSTRFTRFDGSATVAQSWGIHTLNAGVRVAHASDIPVGAIDEYALGGFQQLSGYRPGQIAGNYLAFGRLTYYQRLPWRTGVARALFAGGSLELGNAWTDRSDVSLRDLRSGSSLFVGADTGVGPLYLSLVHARRGYTGIYLFLGRP